MDNIIQSKRKLQNNKAPSLLPLTLPEQGGLLQKSKEPYTLYNKTPFSKRVDGPIGFARDPPKR